MRYLMIDADLNGTGIRNHYNGGYLVPEKLNLRPDTIRRLTEWRLKYEQDHYKSCLNPVNVNKLDSEGKEIARLIGAELDEAKIEYFSAAKITREIVL